MTDERVGKEVMTVRDMYKLSTTPQQWEAMILGLGHILLHEKLSDRSRSSLEAYLWETGYRKAMVEVLKSKGR